MLLWFVASAFADPPAEKSNVVIQVAPTMIEGPIRVVLAGKEGARLYVDEWFAGELPVQTDLAEGPHRFRVETPAGKQVIEAWVAPKVGEVVTLDLATPPKPPAPDAPAP